VEEWLYQVARKLRELRRDQGISLVRLACRLEVNPRSVWSWEHGEHSPQTLRQWEEWAAALGYRLDVSFSLKRFP
jgi:transcriptional regulator with XRE-family HTH domain